MDDLYRAFDDRAQVILQRLDTKQWDLLVGVIESTDRVQHMMWRLIDPTHPMYDKALAAKFGDSIERVYRRCDEFVGEVMSRVDAGTPILIVSDHGFHSFRHVGQPEYLARRAGLHDAAGAGARREEARRSVRRRRDSSGRTSTGRTPGRTRWGSGRFTSISKGAKARASSSPGAEAKAVEDEIAAKLLTLTDPKTGARIVDAVYKRDDVYSGPYVGNAAELQVGLADGYRVSWQTTLGGAPPGIVYPNMKKWSGDHGSYDYKSTDGTLISSRPLDAAETRIIDIAPTVLKYFGLPIPMEALIDGKPALLDRSLGSSPLGLRLGVSALRTRGGLIF